MTTDLVHQSGRAPMEIRESVDVTLAESYESYGSVLSSTGTASSILGYSGEQVDTSGLVFLRARYMQPTLGVFLGRDPWRGDQRRPGSMNGWNYVAGDPINNIDPSGRCQYGDTACQTVAQIIETTYHIKIDRGSVNRDDCDDLFARMPGVSISWTTEELMTLHEALDLTKSFLDKTSHPFDGALGDHGYEIQRVHLTDQGATVLLTTMAPKTQVPDGGISDKSIIASLMHEFFHAFDYLTLSGSGRNQTVVSDDPAFNQGNKEHLYGGTGYDPKYRLDPDSGSKTGACGSTFYACINDRDNFADNAALYALDWLSQRGTESQKSDAEYALSHFPNASPTRVRDWTDLNSFGHSKRRVFFNNYFFDGARGGLGGK